MTRRARTFTLLMLLLAAAPSGSPPCQGGARGGDSQDAQRASATPPGPPLVRGGNADNATRRFFTIRIVDEATGRGVPLVELKTTAGVRYVTDSAGLVAFDDPALMGSTVFFHVSSHGHEFPKDGFGFRGKALKVTARGEATLKIKRLNIAERLYRVTGEGIYRDTVLVGEEPPIEKPLLNAQVSGSDSVQAVVYRGRIHWFWGDTNRPRYPLGNFHMPGATSPLPADGGLDPSVGVNLSYFIAEDGFAKETCRMPGDGPTWLDGLVVLPDAAGSERLYGHYVKIDPPLTVYRHGLVAWDDGAEEFRELAPLSDDAPLYPGGHPFLHRDAAPPSPPLPKGGLGGVSNGDTTSSRRGGAPPPPPTWGGGGRRPPLNVFKKTPPPRRGAPRRGPRPPAPPHHRWKRGGR
ncbi:MAG: hypothetical protein KY476_24775, partial [Planctomycetes bacterium]|nr:hypothetical protein [Planctomycetota bacterium]